MVTINDVLTNDLITELGSQLKEVKEITPPLWADFVKTGVHKERPPVQKDWWYTRTAAVLVTISKIGPIGVSKLTTKYGGRKNRGHKPEVFRKGSGSIIRNVLQQLESAGLIKKVEKATGRQVHPLYNADQSGGVSRLVADIGLARRKLGFKPRTDIDKGLRLLLEKDPQFKAAAKVR